MVVWIQLWLDHIVLKYKTNPIRLQQPPRPHPLVWGGALGLHSAMSKIEPESNAKNASHSLYHINGPK